jgi:phosphate transport system regulatory protein PhoU
MPAVGGGGEVSQTARRAAAAAVNEAPLTAARRDLIKMGRLVADQLERSLRCFHDLDPAMADEVIERDDVIDNLNLSLEERCFDLATAGGLSPEDRRMARAAVKIALNLERIGDTGTHIAKRVRLVLRDQARPVEFVFPELEAAALRAVREVMDALAEADLERARQACLRESEFDARYVAYLGEARRRMQAYPSEVPYLLHCLAVMKYLEKVADYVLNIGEQTIFMTTGRRLKFSQYQQLGQLVPEAERGETEFHPYWDGISGAVVAQVRRQGTPAIYKEGSRRKIEEEARKLEAWARIPGDLTPRVLGSVTVKDREALLREFVDSPLLSELYLSPAPREAKLAATRRLLEAVHVVWRYTLVAEPPRIDYIEQVRRRLPEVYALHPEFQPLVEQGVAVGQETVRIEELLVRAEALEPDLAPPVSVWLHGDFNANNVLYHEPTGQVKFIDVHRSRLGDYLQDIGVFMLSMERRPGTAQALHDDFAAVNELVEGFARRFAAEHGDTAFERRLHLSLARSCITSCRVVADSAQSERLLRRGLSLLALVAAPA